MLQYKFSIAIHHEIYMIMLSMKYKNYIHDIRCMLVLKTCLLKENFLIKS